MAGWNGLEREGNRRYESEDVIVLSPAPPVRRRPAAAGEWQPPEKLFYKTRMCESFVTSGRCMYEEGCTFAHGVAEIRPSLTAVAGGWRRAAASAPAHPPAAPTQAVAQGVHGGGHEFIARANYGGGGGHRSITKVCFEFRDTSTCRFGESCAFPHVSAAEIRQGSRLSYSSMSEPSARRNMAVTVPRTVISVPPVAPPPPHARVVHNNNSTAGGGYGAAPPMAPAARVVNSNNSGSGYGAPSMAPPVRVVNNDNSGYVASSMAPAASASDVDPVDQQQPEQEGRKLTRLEILSRKKMTGIYGDWLDGFVHP